MISIRKQNKQMTKKKTPKEKEKTPDIDPLA